MEFITFLIIVYIIIRLIPSPKKEKRRKTGYNRTSKKATTRETDRLLDQQAQRRKLEHQYSAVINKHEKLELKIENLYSGISKAAFSDDTFMNNIINLCIEDIGLAHDVLRYQKDIDILVFGKEYSEYYYYSFVRLAIIYEKQQRYQEAIRVCENAIRLKATNDGTKGGMKGRLERLKKKAKISKDTEIA